MLPQYDKYQSCDHEVVCNDEYFWETSDSIQINRREGFIMNCIIVILVSMLMLILGFEGGITYMKARAIDANVGGFVKNHEGKEVFTFFRRN